ncbi:hypothetical protein EDC96DRAFT_573698 [Choanephora cucurbitarum]|nr:hypothetical protein EDC96DRAFT_573698 [Choanephora cucurbitarum]
MTFTTANGIEVALCKFKKNVERNKLAEQQGKCCRLNVFLLEYSEPINISDRVITTIWSGCRGKIIAIEKVAVMYRRLDQVLQFGIISSSNSIGMALDSVTGIGLISIPTFDHIIA